MFGGVYLGLFTSKAMGRTFSPLFTSVFHLEWQKKDKHKSAKGGRGSGVGLL